MKLSLVICPACGANIKQVVTKVPIAEVDIDGMSQADVEILFKIVNRFLKDGVKPSVWPVGRIKIKHISDKKFINCEYCNALLKAEDL